MSSGFAFEGERMKTKTEAIRRLNDELRKGLSADGQILVTAGITDLGHGAVNEIMKLVAGFDEFSAENDPYCEHDFGAVQFEGYKIFRKIDYYNRDMSSGSEDPSDPEKTKRVLTIMLASEY